MALGRRKQRERVDYWPGFVDALSTLLLVFMFLLVVFVLGQYFLSRAAADKDLSIEALNRRLAALSDMLSLETTTKTGLEAQLGALSATLAKEQARGAQLATDLDKAQERLQENAGIHAELDTARTGAKDALAQIEMLNQQILALRSQLQAVQSALESTQTREKTAQMRLDDLGSKLNLALAQRVQELNRYRSEFFGRLHTALGQRPDIRVVGDRFVFQSEVFFDTGAADIKPEGRAELDTLAPILKALEQTIPADIAWIVRIDGHTDKRPLAGPRDNWALSTERALAVVRYLVAKGIAPHRLVAAGFGEFAPLEFGDSPEALARNRRLEFKITER